MTTPLMPAGSVLLSRQCAPDGEMGDVYASEIKRAAHKLEGAELESAIKNIP